MANLSDPGQQWSSRLGFLLASIGFAVGLGNIWRFPYVTGENGGGAFVIVYLLCVFAVGVQVCHQFSTILNSYYFPYLFRALHYVTLL